MSDIEINGYSDTASEIGRNARQLLENLALNSAEFDKKSAKRELYLRELAKLINDADGGDDLDLFSAFTRVLDSTGGDKDTADILSALSISKLCKFISQLSSGGDRKAQSGQGGARICYFRNVFTDLAYLGFASVLSDASADYTHDFASACEEVYNGNYDYCILPFASYSDGILSRFISIMQKYELKIAMSCTVSGRDDGFMTFCLLGSLLKKPGEADRMALTLLPEGGRSICESLACLEMMGASVLGCISLPVCMFEESAYFVELDISKADPDAIIRFVELALPDSFISGIYRHIMQ